MKPNFLLIALMILIPGGFCQAQSCRGLFTRFHTATYLNVYAGQESVGKTYAIFKELRDAGLDPHLWLEDLTREQKTVLRASVLKDLSKPIPAVRDPEGRYFLLDGHHSIYVATRLFPQKSDIPLVLSLVYDAKQAGLSWAEFLRRSQQENWFYTPTADAILAHPQHVHRLQNNVERSLLGLFFMSIEDRYKVPMKGKHFKPFVQFYLADLIREHKIMTLPTQVHFEDMPQIRKILLAHPKVIEFLRGHLRESAPDSLKHFLEKLKAKPSRDSVSN